MRSMKTAFLTLTLLSAPALSQDCTSPEVPDIPDGATSTYDQMIEGMGTVKSFQSANSEYMKCLEPLISAASEAAKEADMSDESKAALNKLETMYNEAVSREEALAGQFNTEIREYKAANPE